MIDLLELAAERLSPLLDELVFVGGATIALWITELAAPPTRTTDDVDVICDAMTYSEYIAISDRMRELGFEEDPSSRVICRWRSPEGLAVDLMPQAEDVLGFSNRWYAAAIANAVDVELPSSAVIQATAPALVVATKLEAWRGRGHGDIVRSLDVHDIVVLVNGRPELQREVEALDEAARADVVAGLTSLLADTYFDYVIDDAVRAYASAASERKKVVRERFESIARLAG